MDFQTILPRLEQTLWAARDHGGKATQEIGAIGRFALEQMGVWQAVTDKVTALWKDCNPKVHKVADALRWTFEMTPQELLAAKIRESSRLPAVMVMDGVVSESDDRQGSGEPTKIRQTSRLPAVMVDDRQGSGEPTSTMREMPRWGKEDVKKCKDVIELAKKYEVSKDAMFIKIQNTVYAHAPHIHIFIDT